MTNNSFFEQVHPVYKISLADLVEDKRLLNQDGSVNVVRLTEYSNEELEKFLLYTISWLEIIGFKKAALKSVFLKKEAEYDAERAELFLKKRSSLERKITVKELESEVEADTGLLEKKKKLIEYESYLEYLDNLQNVIELLHYTVKTIINDRSSMWRAAS
jgi:arsenate reductase-like glutaredoxin family protein